MESEATNLAENKLIDLGIESLPIDPIDIADQHGILCKAMPSSKAGVSGMLIKANNNCGILFATHVNNNGFQRFSICHELGHYFLPGHFESLFKYDQVHSSKAGFKSNSIHEKEADEFACGLLMPKKLIDPYLDENKYGLETIKQLSEKCGTSLTSTSLRSIQRTSEAAAIIVSSGNQIDYCFMSYELKEYRNLLWPHKGNLVPNSAITSKFLKDDTNIKKSKELEAYIAVDSWLKNSVSGECKEEVIGLGAYGKTLTVLSEFDFE